MLISRSTTLYSRATFLTPAFAFDLESSDFLSNFSWSVDAFNSISAIVFESLDCCSVMSLFRSSSSFCSSILPVKEVRG